MNPFEDDTKEYCVLINDEQQYSIWPTFLEIPVGWEVVVDRASRKACMDYIDDNWIDMRPRSLREAMER